MDNSFSVFNANIGSMYLWSIKNKLPHVLGRAYASLFNYGRTPSSGLESCARIIQEYQPTAICLQEVYSNTSENQTSCPRLEKMIGPDYRWFASGVGEDERAIVIQKSRVNGHGAENIIPSQGPSFGIAYKLDSPKVWIASVHLRYSNLTQRTQQLHQLLHWANSKKGPVLLTGDFNTHDSWTSFDKKEMASHTFSLLEQSGFQDLSESVDCTWRWGKYLPTAGRIKLDHFFGKGVKAVEKPVAVREHLRGWMDHLALYGPRFEVE